MRALLILLGLLLAGGGAWWVLRAPTDPDLTLDPAGPSRAAGRPPAPETPSLEIPRVGVRGPGDRGMVADPGAEPWETFVLTLRVGPTEPVTGAVLLDAIGERLYVRARSQADLDLFRAQRFSGLRSEGGVTLDMAKTAIERAGWRVGVSDPRFVIRPANADELARAREADVGVR